MQFTVDLSRVRTKTGLHRVLIKTLPFPAHYGKNLDALYDVLTEPHDEWEIRFVGTEQARTRLGDYFDSFWQTLSDAKDDGAAIRCNK
ncbi:MAG: barstar family protein [Treponema sp.]|nr:barstar family protein [Treponema sp.]